MAYRHMRECGRAMKSMLHNESTDSYETVSYGTEYISPNQHGQLFGTIYRRYYQIPTTSSAGDDISISLGFTLSGDIIDYNALIKHGNNRYVLSYENNECYINTSTLNIEIANGSSVIVSGGYVWVDYTKT